MIKLIEKEDLLTAFDSCTLRTYVVYTIRNMSISFLRRQARDKGKLVQIDENYFETAGIFDNAPLPEEAVLMNERKDEFVKVWKTLPDNVRELLAGKYILHLSNEELAEEFGCSPNSIRMMLTRARRQALEKIKKEVLTLNRHEQLVENYEDACLSCSWSRWLNTKATKFRKK